MNAPVVVALALAALPMGWLAAVLVERVPDYAHHVFVRPFRRGDGTTAVRMVLLCAAAAATWAAVAARFDRPVLVAAYLPFAFVALVLSTIDLDTKRLPDRLLLPFLAMSFPALVVVAVVLEEPDRITAAGAGAALYFGTLFLVHLAQPRAIGFGDVKLAALLGLYAGFAMTSTLDGVVLTVWAMLLGFVSGSVIGVVLFMIYGRSRQYPFGPFLCLGAVAAVLLADGLVAGA